MKQEDDKWIKALRDRIDNYSEPVPKDVWASLEKELNIHPKAKLYPFRRWVAAAASVALVILSSVGLYLLFSPADEYMKNVAETISIEEPENLIVKQLEPDAVISIDNADMQKPATRIAQAKAPVMNKDQFETEETTISNNTLSEESATAEEANSEPVKDINRDDQQEPTEEVKNKLSITPETDYQWSLPAKKTKTKSNNWSATISMGNTLADANRTTSGFDMLYKTKEQGVLSPSNSPVLFPSEALAHSENSSSQTRKQVFLSTLNQDVESERKHKTPISFGLSVRYSLSERFAIETGLMYTKLASEIKSGTASAYYREESKLHYLGVPIKGSWAFLNKKHIMLYLSAGGAVEKAISAKMQVTDNNNKSSEENLDIDKLQWSISAALGAQYNISNHFGVYVEPGIVHYFDDGSPIETIRKEKPTNFNLQLGLRLTY